MIAARHDRAAAGLFHRRGDRLRIGRHHRFADSSGFGAAQHVHDHRQRRAISANGLPGRRVEAMRAGMRMMRVGHRGAGVPGRTCTNVDNAAGAYTGCQRPGKPVSDPPPPRPWRYPLRTVTPRFGSRISMNSFELNKILGAVLGTCLILLALNIGAGAIFAPEKPAKPGFDIAVKESGEVRSRRGQGAGAADRSPAGQSVGGKRPGDRQAMPGLPHLREGRPEPRRSQSVGYRRQRRGEGLAAGFNYLGRDEGARAANGPSTSSTSSWPIRADISRERR